ncbi:MAG: undecaprenyl-phosphate galactose phosphotransferase WbaP [Planctomycetes bacterium]|nr:undecaprenyl-phosphate galactose phosphotransferase WbaP [Planctomycetota bacterium]
MRIAPDITPSRPFLRPAQTKPRLTCAALFAADTLAVLASAFAAVAIRDLAAHAIQAQVWQAVWITPLPFMLAFAVVGLYPGIAMAPAEELRRTTLVISLVYVVLAAAIFLSQGGPLFSRGALMLAWGFSVIAVPLARGLLRMAFCRRAWWGAPVVVLGSGPRAASVVHSLAGHPELGLKPFAVLDDAYAGDGGVAGVPIVGKQQLAPVLGRDLHVPYAIVAMPDQPPGHLLAVIERYGKIFPHLIVVPELFGQSLMWMSTRDLGGVPGLEVQQRLLLSGPRLRKRLFDLVLLVPLGLIAAALTLLVATAIRATSRGPVFYAQTRIGQGGRRFQAWKFRSMVIDADAVLESHLTNDPALKLEWERDHKLRDDPRVTRVGRLLRRTSMDELPQLWNVLRGEMSLIGPRPIVQAEVERYLDRFHLYGKIKPGMTGLWQVSGRNDTTYDERIGYDAYYTRNWSVWLDLHILARTAWVVAFGRGAY